MQSTVNLYAFLIFMCISIAGTKKGYMQFPLNNESEDLLSTSNVVYIPTTIK